MKPGDKLGSMYGTSDGFQSQKYIESFADREKYFDKKQNEDKTIKGENHENN